MKQTSEIKLMLVSEDSIFRTALSRLLENERNLKVVSKAYTIEEVTKLSGMEKPDLILVDLPENKSSFAFFSSFQKLDFAQPILILSESNNIKINDKCLRVGVSGLISKENGSSLLFKAIEKVYRGEFWFERFVMGHTIKRLVNEQLNYRENLKNSNLHNFTEREKEVINLICQGLKNKQIADKLFITETTVRHHLSSVFEKLNVSSRLELVVYAFEHKLVKIPKQVKAQ